MSPSVTPDKLLIALVGPPNAGKTTLFNTLTGTGSQPVNYPGATVEYAKGITRKSLGVEFRIVDTPGTYSLAPKSSEEKVTHDLLFDPANERPAALILVVDGTQLSRHIPLARHVQESGYPVAIAVTMRDLLDRDGMVLDVEGFSRKMGAPAFLVQGSDGASVSKIAHAVAALAARPRGPVQPPTQWSNARQAQELKWSAEIASACVRTPSPSEQRRRTVAEQTRRIDRLLLHPIFGLVFFVAIMSALFTSIFWLAAPVMDAVTTAFESLAAAVLNAAPGALWADFLAGGVVMSAASILVFVPQIAILFLGISLLEDSGYLARAATLVDKPLTRLGLNGRSFVPMLSGYACAIPAMMAARTIPNRKERYLTLFVIPLMSCSARLPVYSLLLAFLFWGQAAWKPGVALALIYLTSLVVGSVAAAIANRLLPAQDGSFFLMELPVYRRPSAWTVFKTVWNRSESYLRKAGPAIFVFAVVLWCATTFPHYETRDASQRLNTSYAAQAGKAITPLMQPMGGDWRTGVALISAFAAREVFVSSLGLVLQVSEEDEEKREVSILDSMRRARRADGSELFTPASVVGLVLFFMIALQCMSTVAVARREFGSWKLPLIQLAVFNLAGYAAAVLAVQVLRAVGIP